MDYREYWQEVDAIAALLSDPDQLAEEYGEEAEPSEVLFEITDGHQFVIYTFKASKVLEHSDNTDAYFDHVGEITADSWSAIVTPLAIYAMQADITDRMGRANPSRARGRGRGRMGRRNFEPYQHAWLARQSRGVSGEYETTAQAARKLGDDKAADVADRRAIAWDIRAHNEDLAEAGNWDEARDRVGRNLKYAERTRKSWQDRARRGTANPPRDGKWHRVASGYALRGADQYVAVVPYKPRGQGTVGGNARRFAEVYEHQKGAKVPKGTKYLAALAWYGEPMMKILGAHKTLKAAKAAGAKALGIKAPRRRARANAHNGAGAVVLVKTSARARPVRVKLPAKTKPKRVGDLTVHRSISYKGSKLRLLKGWTVTTSAGRGVGRYKTKQAAMAAARRAR
jgi:hypothetical protein